MTIEVNGEKVDLQMRLTRSGFAHFPNPDLWETESAISNTGIEEELEEIESKAAGHSERLPASQRVSVSSQFRSRSLSLKNRLSFKAGCSLNPNSVLKAGFALKPASPKSFKSTIFNTGEDALDDDSSDLFSTGEKVSWGEAYDELKMGFKNGGYSGDGLRRVKSLPDLAVYGGNGLSLEELHLGDVGRGELVGFELPEELNIVSKISKAGKVKASLSAHKILKYLKSAKKFDMSNGGSRDSSKGVIIIFSFFDLVRRLS